MAKTDSRGRPYATLSGLGLGDEIVTDGIDCIAPWTVVVVERFGGELGFRCSDGGFHCSDGGFHWLIEQLDSDGDTLIGVYRAGVITKVI